MNEYKNWWIAGRKFFEIPVDSAEGKMIAYCEKINLIILDKTFDIATYCWKDGCRFILRDDAYIRLRQIIHYLT